MGAKPHVLLIGEAVTLSHVVRPAVLATALHNSGYEVTLACDPRFNALLGPQPFRVIPIRSSVDPETVPEMRLIPKPLFDGATLDRYISEDRRLMHTVGAEVVIGDMRQSLAVSAKRAGVPFINLIDAQFSPHCEMELEVARPSWMPPLPDQVNNLIRTVFHPPAHFLMALPSNLARMRHQVEGWHEDARDVYSTGDYVLYPDIPEIVPIDGLPPNHHFIGPILWSPSVTMPPWWDSLPSGPPIVFVNISGSSPRHLLPTTLEALADLPVTVIAVGNEHKAGSAAGKNVFIADIVPGREAAERADLVICNGGNMAVQQSLAVGTPVLCLPSYAEQLMYSRAIAATGAGTRIEPSEAGVSVIRRQVEGMLSHSAYRKAAQQIARVMARYDAGKQVKKLVDAICVERAA